LQNKLEEFQRYYNADRGYCGIDGIPPLQKSDDKLSTVVPLNKYR